MKTNREVSNQREPKKTSRFGLEGLSVECVIGFDPPFYISAVKELYSTDWTEPVHTRRVRLRCEECKGEPRYELTYALYNEKVEVRNSIMCERCFKEIVGNFRGDMIIALIHKQRVEYFAHIDHELQMLRERQ